MIKKRARHQIADAAVQRWCRFYEVTPYFWRVNKNHENASIIRHAEDRRRRRKSDVIYGEAEDRADCMAMIVGTLYVKGFERSELSELLEIAGGTVHLYLEHYRSMPDETRRDLIALDGAQAPGFYHSVIVDAKIDSMKRLLATRAKIKEMNGR